MTMLVDDLLAYGQQQSHDALSAKDREQYQFWQGWIAALDRVAAAPVPPAHDGIIQNWFCTLPMTKSQKHKAINWDDCEELIRKLLGGTQRRNSARRSIAEPQ